MDRIYDIENGYFIFTVFSSLRCKLDCEHCYLSKEQRRNSPILDLNKFEEACIKVNDYFINEIPEENEKNIYLYWYGGEPTELGVDYFYKAKEITNRVFSKKITVKHMLLTNLMTDQTKWLQLYKDFCDSHVQSSYDYHMRGQKYLELWKKNVKYLKSNGIKVSAINVVNNTMLGKEKEIYDDYQELDLDEIGFLPFMKNTTNMTLQGKNFLNNRATMKEFSEFNINLTKMSFKYFPKITITNGNVYHIMKNYFNQSEIEEINIRNNIARQTMFLLPDGNFCLPDYYDNYFENNEYIKWEKNITPVNYVELKQKHYILDNGVEYLRNFENIFDKSFKEVLNSSERQNYLNKQITRDNREECKNCEYSNICLMEFWKTNNLDDSGECPGGKLFIKWLIEYYEGLSNLQKIAFKKYIEDSHLK